MERLDLTQKLLPNVQAAGQNLSHRFATGKNFLDPQLTEDGKPFGPSRYKQITKEIYYITKMLNISYHDIMEMTPREKNYFLEFISEDAKRQAAQMKEAQKKQSKARR